MLISEPDVPYPLLAWLWGAHPRSDSYLLSAIWTRLDCTELLRCHWKCPGVFKERTHSVCMYVMNILIPEGNDRHCLRTHFTGVSWYEIILFQICLRFISNSSTDNTKALVYHDDVIKWKDFQYYWPFFDRWFPSQRPVTWSFDVFFDLCLNKRLSKQSRCRWFETPSHSLWRHCNDYGSIPNRRQVFTWTNGDPDQRRHSAPPGRHESNFNILSHCLIACYQFIINNFILHLPA